MLTHFALAIASNTTADSGTFGGVSLTQGALGSIGLLGSNYIDLQSANISVLCVRLLDNVIYPRLKRMILQYL